MNAFKGEFIEFLSEQTFFYEEKEDNCFFFPKQNVAIILVFLSKFDKSDVAESNGSLNFEVIKSNSNVDFVHLYEDRWFSNKELIKKRILSRLGVFTSIFARKCKVISDTEIKADSRKNTLIKEFLNSNHTYGDAKCKYRYALEYNGQIVAVATFSASRPMPRQIAAPMTDGDESLVIFDSYEWIRYASLPDYRVVGGMGRLLKTFLADVGFVKRPVEVMTYSDTEWSSGDVYEKLGFHLVQEREAVDFFVDKKTYKRVAVNKFAKYETDILQNADVMQIDVVQSDNIVRIKNRGSKKYLLQQSL